MRYAPAIENEFSRYMAFFDLLNTSRHGRVNNYITRHGRWDEFPELRSLNDHGEGKENVPGIWKWAYREVCRRRNITNGGGAPLRGCRGY